MQFNYIGNQSKKDVRLASSFANGAFVTANASASFANGAFLRANSGYGVANSGASFANAAFDRANAAFAQANTATASPPITIYSDVFTANGATTTFNLSTTPTSENYITAIVDGITQLRSTYTVTGNVVVFDSAFESGANVEITTIAGGSSLDPYSAATANGAFDRANAAYNAANTGGSGTDSYARDTANAAFVTANAAFLQANNSTDTWVRTQANNAYDKANSSASFANAAFVAANSGASFANAAFDRANASYGVANSGSSFANGAFTKANNALANTTGTFNGDLSVTGVFKSLASSGPEGGEIQLATATTGSTLAAGTVTIDIYANKLRIFESGGTNRGAFIDLSAATAGVGSDLLSGGGGGTTDTTARASAAAAFDAANSAASFANGAFTTANNALPKSGGTITGNVIFSGTNANLHFSGAAARITGDFSNATLASRTMFRSSTTNGTTNIYAVPNGTATGASWAAFNDSDPTNASYINIVATATDHRITSGLTGTGSYLPFTIYTGGSERFRIDTSGNASIPGTLIIQSTTASTSNTTGAFEVIGGVGIQGNLYTGAIRVTGPASNGITFADGTTQYTANVLDSWVRGTTNASFLTANSGASFANGAFARANAAFEAANIGGTSFITNGTSNVSITTSGGNIYMNVGGVNIINVSDTWANVTGNISATQGVYSNVVNTISVYATSDIITGNIRTTGSGGNISGANYITANYFSGQGPELTNLKPNTHMTIALSDETTSITTGTAKITFRAPFAMTLTQIPRASLSTTSSSGNPTVDIDKNGVSIFSTLLSIDAGEKTSTTAATPAVLSTSTFADDDEITMDISTAGTGAKGLKVTLYYRKT
jgi:hypothetical protein